MDEANNVGQIPTYISVYYLFQYSVPHALEPKRGIEQFVNGHPITKFEPEKKIKKRKKNKSPTHRERHCHKVREAYQQTESLLDTQGRQRVSSMAATRAITIASNSTCSLLAKKPFVGGTALSLNNLNFCRTRRSYTCRAIYNPQVVVKEEGQPETLDYRVFFVDKSGKKVPFLFYFYWASFVFLICY